VFWGTVKAGAVAVPVNPLMAAEDYEFLLTDSGAKVVVVEERVAPKVHAVREHCPALRAVVGTQALEDLLARANAALAPAPTRADDVMYWGYTSGSTGRPKAALHTHAHFRAAAEHVGRGVFGLGPGDLVFSASKMYFSFGLGNTLYFPAAAGAASL